MGKRYRITIKTDHPIPVICEHGIIYRCFEDAISKALKEKIVSISRLPAVERLYRLARKKVCYTSRRDYECKFTESDLSVTIRKLII